MKAISVSRRSAGMTAVVLTLAGIGGTSLLAGCGGSDTGSTATSGAASAATGRATITIVWPTQSATTSRVIPVDSRSIIVSFSRNGSLVTQQIVARPATGSTSLVNFPSLPTGTLTAQAAAYPNSDGTGVPQAVASVSATIVSAQNTPVAITMNSTVNHIAITPTSATIVAGTTTTLSETAYDNINEVVLTSGATIGWASSNTTVATVSATGVVTAVAAGTATITVTESESGVTATVPITVNTPVSVSISPTTATLTVATTQTFAATVTGSSNPNVTWSVQEGASGGTITSAGVYTAPATAGTYHVIATSVVDPSKQAVVVVTVQAIGPQIVYQNDFEGAVGQEWSQTNTEVTPLGARRFLGRFGPGPVSLSLANLPAHKTVTISFKLFIIRSWDGNEVTNVYGVAVGPDFWTLALDNLTLLHTTFGNWEPGSTTDNVLQSYPNAFGSGAFPSRTGASENNTLGYPSFQPPYPGPYQDSVYDLTFTSAHTASTATFVFTGGENQDITDESWGIDDVVVSVSGT